MSASSALFPRRIHNLQQPIETVLRCRSDDSLPLMSAHLPTFLRRVRVTPQALEQQRFFVVQRREIKRNPDKNRGNMDQGNGPQHGKVSRKHGP
ncbi:hypothetical protein AVEN_206654-1 [Araneus ventricosus]|uniref:Uncharacterized protein n=1 Tax=Araneus ventricosus TaxID=182803 RepID=A0A4Y2H4I9_ARAVE|nr:hypothetical protein AVEN_206654-1 [Araneus ventricosus]